MRSFSLTKHLLILTVFTALPLIALSFFVVDRLVQAERETIRKNLIGSAKSLASATTGEVEEALVVARLLTRSRALLGGDLAEFQKQALEVLPFFPGAELQLSGPEGESTLRIGRPDVPQPSAQPSGPLARETVQRVLTTGMPVVSDVSIEQDKPVVVLHVPVVREGVTNQILSLRVSTARFQQLLANQNYPEDWVSGILDAKGHFIARIPGPDRVATPASDGWRAAIARAREGVIENTLLEGDPVVTAYAATPLGWSVGVAVRKAMLDTPVYRTLGLLSVLAGLSLLVSLLLAWLIGRRLALGVGYLESKAGKMILGQPMTIMPTGVSDYDRLLRVFAEASARLLQQQRELRDLADAMPQLVWSADPSGRIAYFNRKRADYKATTDAPDWQAIIHPEDLAPTREAWRATLEAGTPYSMEHRLMRADGTYAWHLTRALPFHDAAGNLTKWVGTATDIDGHKQREQHIHVLMAEVNHRSKNILTVIQGIARLTSSSTTTLAEFREKFEARLHGLAASQDLLVGQNWHGVDLMELARLQMGHYAGLEGERVRISGPAVFIAAEASQSIGMALHELSTNAAKYGALQNGEGVVELTWAVVDTPAGPDLIMDWTERNGPAVKPPKRRGFGTAVIERMLGERMRGKVELRFPPEGLCWRFRVPLANLTSEAAGPERSLTE